MPLGVSLPLRGWEPAGEQNILGRTTPAIAVYHRADMDPKLPRPLGKRLSFPLICQPKVVAFVAALLKRCGPPDVTRSVWSRIVDSVQRIFGARAKANVLYESSERFIPTGAYCNAAPPIVGVRAMVRIVTSRLYGAPYLVFNGIRHVVFDFARSYIFQIFASATLASTAPKTLADDRPRSAAIATAEPVGNKLFGFDVFRFGDFVENRPTPKAFAGQINKVVCAGARGIITHVVSSFAAIGHAAGLLAQSPRRFYSVRTSPLYHNIAESLLPWPMESRAVAELGVSVNAIIQEYAGN